MAGHDRPVPPDASQAAVLLPSGMDLSAMDSHLSSRAEIPKREKSFWTSFLPRPSTLPATLRATFGSGSAPNGDRNRRLSHGSGPPTPNDWTTTTCWQEAGGAMVSPSRGCCPPAFRPTFRGLLWANFLYLLLVNLADLTICALAPCALRSVGTEEMLAEDRCVDEILLVLMLRTPGVLGATLLSLGHFFYKFFKVLRYQPSGGWLGCLTRRSSGPGGRGGAVKTADAWSPASSREVFLDTMHYVRTSNRLTCLILMPFIVATFGFQLHSSMASPSKPTSGDDNTEQNICRTSELCRYAYSYATLLLKLNANLLLLATMSVQTMPPSLWSAPVLLAATRTGDVRLRRLQSIPTLGAVSYLLLFQGVVHQQLRLSFQKAGPAEVSVFCLIMVVTVVYNVFLLWRSMALQDLISLVTGRSRTHRAIRLNRVAPESSMSTASSAASEMSQMSTKPAPEVTAAMYFAGLWSRLGSLVGLSEFGARSHQEVILMVQLVLWSDRVISRATLSECVAIYVLRAFACCLLFNARDQPSGPKDISDKPGFGLVVSASVLRRCLQAAISGRAAPVASIPTYKGTLARMGDTLAVSYRWQSTEAILCPGQSINMSRFQMQAVVDALRHSGASYVWLDRISVPQAETEVKYTLLARMMAIYSVASLTVAIRSREAEGGRYHQRAWTFQEFCTCRRLYLVTEPGADAEAGRLAVTGPEHLQMSHMREDFLRAASEMVPLWLRTCPGGQFSPEEAREALDKFRSLDRRLTCAVRGDKIRALCPLLASTPVESSGDLMKLLVELSRAAGEDLHQWKEALFDQYLTRSGHSPSDSTAPKPDDWKAPAGAELRRVNTVQVHGPKRDCETYLSVESASKTASVLSYASLVGPGSPGAAGEAPAECEAPGGSMQHSVSTAVGGRPDPSASQAESERGQRQPPRRTLSPIV